MVVATSHRLVYLARLMAVAVAVVALVVLYGYAVNSLKLIRVAPGLQGMSPLTALGLLTLGAGIIAESVHACRLAAASAWAGLALGGGLLAMHATRHGDPLSPAIAQLLYGWTPGDAGRMSVSTALCIAALSVAALFPLRARISNSLLALTATISGMAILGYAYGVHDLYAVPVFDTIALHTALSLFALALAAVLLRSRHGFFAVIASDGETGAGTRRKLALTLAPPAIAWALMRATDADKVGPGAAVAFLVALTIAPLIFLIVRNGQTSLALERERERLAALQASQARELEDRLASQADQLRQQNEARQKVEEAMYQGQRLDAIGQLTGGIAHDFNNLLMAVSGNLELLKRHLPEDHPGTRFADNLGLAVSRGTKLTSQLLAFSRTQKLDIKPVEIDASMRRARELIGNALGPEIDVSVRLATEGFFVATDSDQLELAILNLAINARDAMPNGGALTIETVLGMPERTALIRVTDTGEGMSEEIMARAAEPFFTTKERGKGTGLGLAQVFGFVRQCGGGFDIQSAIGKGTTITLSLPLADPVIADTAIKHGALAASEKTGAGQVLVIDDDDDVRGVIAQSLQALGYDVVEADSGLDGLAFLELFRPSVAIVDFIMPAMNGAEVAKKAQQLYPNLPIIFVSGYSDTMALDRVSHAQVLRKPFTTGELHQAVQSAQGLAV